MLPVSKLLLDSPAVSHTVEVNSSASLTVMMTCHWEINVWFSFLSDRTGRRGLDVRVRRLSQYGAPSTNLARTAQLPGNSRGAAEENISVSA